MEDFRRQFTLEAAAKLEAVAESLRREKPFSDSFKRETFRTLHTIKGTAQTFGLPAASRLAHRLETLLAADDFSGESFGEGVALLRKSLTDEDFQIPEKFLEKIGVENPAANGFSENLARKIPDKFLATLSAQEKSRLQTALKNKQNLFCLEINFPLDDFADGLIRFRETLAADGEIIATLPSGKFGVPGEIGFQILYAASNEAAAVKTLAEKSGAEIVFDSTESSPVNDLHSVAELAARHGAEIARKDGKQIRFEIAADETEVSGDRLKIVFDVLLHLVRNAVDHAIERRGKIEIRLHSENEMLHLKVSDDGAGINTAAVRAKAVERNLIAADADLTERELIELIFKPEFSTKSAVTEISGRGIGLNAVATLVEKQGGKINVESRVGKGTTFEIALPLGQNESDAE